MGVAVLALAVEVCRLRADSPDSARRSDAAVALGAHPALLKYCISCADPNLDLLRRLVELSSGSTNRSVDAELEIFNACSERKPTMASAIAGASETLECERTADERSTRSN